MVDFRNVQSKINYLKNNTVLLLVETDKEIEEVEVLCKVFDFISVVIIMTSRKSIYEELLDRKIFIDNKVRIVQYNKSLIKNDLNSLNCVVDVILFSKKINKEITDFFYELEPKIVFAEFNTDKLDYYHFWQKYRKVCEHLFIYVHTYIKREAIEWHKDHINPIELSIILPIYNVEKYLEKCIKNLSPDINYFEIVAVNDGSPDNSIDVLERLKNEDERIVIVDKENGGCASARKKGLEVARGRYVGFVDPDDFTNTDMFEKLHKRAILGDYDVCYTGYNNFYESNNQIEPVTHDAIYKPYCNGVYDEENIKNLVVYLRIAIWRGIYKKSFLDKNGITFNPVFKRSDDLPFKIEVYAQAKSVVSLVDFGYYYRLGRPGQDEMRNDESLFVHLDIFEYLDKTLITKLNNPKVTDRLTVVKLDTHLWVISKLRKDLKRKYYRKARKDFLSNASIFRALIVCWNYKGKQYFWKCLKFLFGFNLNNI